MAIDTPALQPAETDTFKIVAAIRWTLQQLAAVLPITSTGGLGPPQGRLTLLTGVPVLVTNETAKTTIFYALYVGDQVPIYDGSSFVQRTIIELSLALDSNSGHTGYHQSGKLFDLFVDYNSGTPRLVSGPAWTNSTTRADAIARLNGIWTNNASVVTRFGTGAGDTATIGANLLTYVGTFYATANGQTGMNVQPTPAAGGTNNILGLWNAYNREPVTAFNQDSTASWSVTSASFEALNVGASSGLLNRVSFVDGLAQSEIRVAHFETCAAGATFNAQFGSVLDSTTATPAGIGATTDSASSSTAPVPDRFFPQTGFHYIQAVQKVSGGTATFAGGGFQGLTVSLEM